MKPIQQPAKANEKEDANCLPEEKGVVSNTTGQQQQSIDITITTSTATTTLQATTSGVAPEMKRSAVKALIERYFYQLQRGCGNPKCQNPHCASSGQVPAMSADEMAAKSLQLFSQDAQLCDCNSPAKVARTDDDSPTCSRYVTVAPPSQNGPRIEVLSLNDNSMSSTSSGNSTVTSGSTQDTSSPSTSISSTTSSSNSTNTVDSDVTMEEALLLKLFNREATLLEVLEMHAANAKQAKPPAVPKQLSTDNPEFEYLTEDIIDQLLEEYRQTNSRDHILFVLNDVFSEVQRLGKSFCKPPSAAAKIRELRKKPRNQLKKEELRVLEGENDKDKDDDENDGDEDRSRLPSALRFPCSSLESTTNTLVRHFESMGEPLEDDDLACAYLSYIHDRPIPLDMNSSDTKVEFDSLRRVRDKLFQLDSENCTPIANAIADCVAQFEENVRRRSCANWERVLHCLIIFFDIITGSEFSTIPSTCTKFDDMQFMESTVPKLCNAASIMPIEARARLARIWARNWQDRLGTMVRWCQQLITVNVMYVDGDETVQKNPKVRAMTKALKIAHYANIMAGMEIYPHINCLQQGPDAIIPTAAAAVPQATGNVDGGDTKGASTSADAAAAAANTEDVDTIVFKKVPQSTYFPTLPEDELEKELKLSTINCRMPLIPYHEFYNDSLSDSIHKERDYLAYRDMILHPYDAASHFSYIMHSFIMSPSSKVLSLYYDSRVRMLSERNTSTFSTAMCSFFGDLDGTERTDLRLNVRREHLIEDALVALESVATTTPKDLKKQLVVKFIGEHAIDEGGVSKEFFQLIVEEIFKADFGMFVFQEDTETVWFNSAPFENEAQFTLIGIIVGLAIYNNIVLAVNFPMVLYRKLMGHPGIFYDLIDLNPAIYRSLKTLLDYEGDDMEKVFMQTFQISFPNVFGDSIEHELKPNGGQIAVGQHNKKEFVDLYSDFLLNGSVARQFKAFKKGFDMVTDQSPLKLLFRPEEIDLLVCGSKNFNFGELEMATEYEGGYTKDTKIIKYFWEIVHAMSQDLKHKLLEFTTGSNRAPVGGLGRLKLIITRHGSDSDRLPTSHTCFNVLLLPEYCNKSKLEERLLKAINYSKGFGML